MDDEQQKRTIWIFKSVNILTAKFWLQGGLSPVLQYVESTIWPKKASMTTFSWITYKLLGEWVRPSVCEVTSPPG